MKSNGGFTLLEILVVVMIITILATIVGVNVYKDPGKAKVAAAKAQISGGFMEALERYRMDNGFFPTQEQGLDALRTKPGISPVPKDYPEEGYMRKIPSDPWGNPYVYLIPGSKGAPYEIISYGADGEPGGEGEKADISSADL